MANLIDALEIEFARTKPLSPFQVGDTVEVHVLIQEGEKSRIQIFAGTVIKIQGRKGLRATFTVRRIVANEGVERTFPYHSPVVQDVKVTRKGKVRRSKLFYLRDRVGKSTRVKERRDDAKPTAAPKGKKQRRKARQEAKDALAASASAEAEAEAAAAAVVAAAAEAESAEASEAAAGVS
jgi:large subunit ribosomal protein L19